MAIQSNFPAIRPSLLLDFANSKRLDPRITFTRASTARYYDGSTVAKAEENLLTYSQAMDNAAWSKQRCTITADDQVAPDGTTTGDKANCNSTSANGFYVWRTTGTMVTVPANSTIALSAFVKLGSRNQAQLSFYSDAVGTNGANAFFDISAGTYLSSASFGSGVTIVGTPTITAFANSWYRLGMVVTSNTTQAMPNILPSITSSADISCTSGVDYGYIWGVQMEIRSAVTAYTATTAAPITNYIPQLLTAAAGVPRFDHNPTTGESLGLLIEPAKTNSFTYSQEFDNAYWTKSNASILTAQNVAPDGTLTAQILDEGTTATVTHGLTRSMTMTINVNYSVSVYVKNITGQYLTIAFMRSSGGGTMRGYKFDLVNLTAPVLYSTGTNFNFASASIAAVGNGWYRIEMNVTMTGSVVTPLISIGMWDGVSSTFNSATGLYEYTGTGRQMYIWGAQFTTGAGADIELPTSYIATSGATATRQADAASMTGTNFSSWYDAAEGTVYTQLTPGFLSEGAGVSVNAASANQRIRLAMTSTTEQAIVTTNGTAQATLDAGDPSVGTSVRAALAYKVNDFALSLNGGTVATDTNGTIPVVSQMQIGATTTTTGIVRIAKLAYYPLRLTDAQLQAITG